MTQVAKTSCPDTHSLPYLPPQKIRKSSVEGSQETENNRRVKHGTNTSFIWSQTVQ